MRKLGDTVGDLHPDTLTVRYHAALFLAKRETREAIEQALRIFAELLPDFEQVFGVNSRWTAQVRSQLPFWPKYLRDNQID